MRSTRTRSTPVEIERLLPKAFPWCSDWAGELKALFRAYALAKQARGVLDYDDLLLYWAKMMASAPIAEDIAAPVRLRPG